MRLRPTLSFRQKPEPPVKPFLDEEERAALRPTLSFRQKPEPPVKPLVDDDDHVPLRPTFSFRQKPEPPKPPNLEDAARLNILKKISAPHDSDVNSSLKTTCKYKLFRNT